MVISKKTAPKFRCISCVCSHWEPKIKFISSKMHMGLLYLALVNYSSPTRELISCELDLKDTGTKITAIVTHFKVIHPISFAFLLYCPLWDMFFKLEFSIIVKVPVVTIAKK